MPIQPDSWKTNIPPRGVSRRGRRIGRPRKRLQDATAELGGDDCSVRLSACKDCAKQCVDLIQCCAGRCKLIERKCGE